MNIYNASRTIYNIKLQTCMMAGLPYTPLPNTTLNEKFDILQYKQFNCLEEPVYPTIKGIVIGNGGKEILDSDLINIKLGKHSPLDGALFNHLPFVLRKESEDLTNEERKNYRLRKELYINGNKYIAYYLKMFKDDDLYYNPEILYIDNNKIIPTIKLFNTDRTDILNPDPNLDNRISTYENSVQTVNVLRFNFNLSVNEINELNNVFNILDIDDKLITELGIVTGVDYDNDGYIELIHSQIAYFIDVSADLELLDNEGMNMNIEIGGGEIIPIRKDINV